VAPPLAAKATTAQTPAARVPGANMTWRTNGLSGGCAADCCCCCSAVAAVSGADAGWTLRVMPPDETSTASLCAAGSGQGNGYRNDVVRACIKLAMSHHNSFAQGFMVHGSIPPACKQPSHWRPSPAQPDRAYHDAVLVAATGDSVASVCAYILYHCIVCMHVLGAEDTGLVALYQLALAQPALAGTASCRQQCPVWCFAATLLCT
jgi:hypothetical protein